MWFNNGASIVVCINAIIISSGSLVVTDISESFQPIYEALSSLKLVMWSFSYQVIYFDVFITFLLAFYNLLIYFIYF